MRFLQHLGFLFFILSGSLTSQAQDFQLVQSIPLNARPTAASISNYGNLYFADVAYNFFKYSPQGEILQEISIDAAPITSVHAYQTLNVFTFQEDVQVFTIYNRLLTPVNTQSLYEVSNGFIRFPTFAVNGMVWWLNQSTLSLESYQIETQQILQTIPLNQIVPSIEEVEVTDFQFYQNKLFLVLKNQEVLVFDDLGNFQKSLPIPTEKISFYRDKICNFITKNQ